MFKLDAERSIHIKTPPAEPPTDPNWVPRFRKTTRSPFEEMQSRMSRGTMQPVPDALAALIMQEKRSVKVEPNGFAFEIDCASHRYWSADSRTCHPSNVGQKVLISFDRDNLDCVYVMSDDGRYVETIPEAEKVAWFDPALDEKIREQRRVAQHVHQGMKRTHAATTKREHYRTKANAEAVQAVNEFRPPAPPARPDAQDAPPRRFAVAEETHAAQETMRQSKRRFETMERDNRQRLRRAEVNAETLLNTGDEDEFDDATTGVAARVRLSAESLL